jgi:acetyltransferase-like isoleucine patch superfamily enzyme
MGSFRSFLEHQLIGLYRPRIIWGYKRADGVVMRNTRISNTTFIDGKKHADIRDHVFIGHHNFIEASNGLVIGEGVQITNFISILTHSSHQSIRLYGKHYVEEKELIGYVRGRVEIGNYTFIGPHSLILPGTRIGKGCLVAAYSYVAGEYPDFSVIKGNPAKVTGDTRELDRPLLDAHPELQAFYDAWSKV